jgi:hypothetical protein
MAFWRTMVSEKAPFPPSFSQRAPNSPLCAKVLGVAHYGGPLAHFGKFSDNDQNQIPSSPKPCR